MQKSSLTHCKSRVQIVFFFLFSRNFYSDDNIPYSAILFFHAHNALKLETNDALESHMYTSMPDDATRMHS